MQKCELTNLLNFRDSQTPSSSNNSTSSKIEGLTKVNNFLRKKEFEAKEESALLRHKLDILTKERLAASSEAKKLNQQVSYLQGLLRMQRS